MAITGASGVGKTFITKEISSRLNTRLQAQYFHFDDIGMPNWDEVDSKKWQQETTIEWINKLVEISRDENVHIVFEGSTDFKFFIEGFEQNEFSDYQLLLFDCQKETIEKRLAKRGQPELFTSDMVNWLHYLRREAIIRDYKIVRTDHLAIEEIEQILFNSLYENSTT